MKWATIAAAGLLTMATGAQAQVFTQNFTANTTGFTGGTVAVTPNGERYLQLANGQTSVFAVATAGYTGLSLAFDLYGIESLDGNGPAGGGPDNFVLTVAGGPSYTFNIANYTAGGNTQSFNGNLTQIGGPYAPLTGATALGTLGYGTGTFGDSTYHIVLTLPNAALTSISFTGLTNEPRSFTNGTLGGNEAYGIDNFVLTGQAIGGAVPEPATWAMMLAGFGAMGFALRRRATGRRAIA